VVRATWACYDGAAIETRQTKTGFPVWVPAHYRLREILDAAPRVSPIIVIGERGKPYPKDTLRNLFFRLIGRLAREGKVGPGLSFHGLRHTLGTQLAEAGCDAQTIASILGQQSTAMAEHYSRTANRRGNATAAIEKLERKDRGRGERTATGNGKLPEKRHITN
jgi:integrase